MGNYMKMLFEVKAICFIPLKNMALLYTKTVKLSETDIKERTLEAHKTNPIAPTLSEHSHLLNNVYCLLVVTWMMPF
jgi:hypothetical protein